MSVTQGRESSRSWAIAARYLQQTTTVINSIPLAAVAMVADRLYSAFLDDRLVMIVGNGGSGATASHMACDLNKNIVTSINSTTESGLRRFGVLALTDNMALITALANDDGYASVFAHQVRMLIKPDDLLIAISGSGNSENIVEAVRTANESGAETIGILGRDGGLVGRLVRHAVIVPHEDYGPIEDAHLAINHLLVACLRDRVGHDAQESAPHRISLVPDPALSPQDEATS